MLLSKFTDQAKPRALQDEISAKFHLINNVDSFDHRKPPGVEFFEHRNILIVDINLLHFGYDVVNEVQNNPEYKTFLDKLRTENDMQVTGIDYDTDDWRNFIDGMYRGRLVLNLSPLPMAEATPEPSGQQ